MTLSPRRTSVRSWRTTAILVLLLPELLASLSPLLLRELAGDAQWLQRLALALALLAAWSVVDLCRSRPDALWIVLVLLSLEVTTEVAALAQHAGGPLPAIVLLLMLATALLALSAPADSGNHVSPYQRVLFGVVAIFASIVAYWGLLLPQSIGHVLPLTVPPLHARFLGSMYLSGAVFMLLGMGARRWSELKVVTLMLAIWTGMLGIVSALHLPAFDWSRISTWLWFFAYIDFPLIALWIVWTRRAAMQSDDSGRSLTGSLRIYLNVQGVVVLLLAFSLLFFPSLMSTLWPWPIKPLVAQIYSAPFLSYGIGSLYAARMRGWGEVWIMITSTLVFALAVLGACILHANLFNVHSLSTWLWFAGFALQSAALLIFILMSRLGRSSGLRVGS